MASVKIECALAFDALLGESPIWDERANALYFVDIRRHTLNRWSASSGEVSTWMMPSSIGCAGLRQTTGLVVALKSEIMLVDDLGALTPLATLDIADDLRFNDGRCDRFGRFWAGTQSEPRRPHASALYCIDPTGAVLEAQREVTVSNGTCFSPDDRVMYFADSFERTVYAYAFDGPQGSISKRRVFARFAAEEGVPDGATVDRDGCVWYTHFNGWLITRFAPDGAIEQRIRLPVQYPTSCSFGGSNLATLFVTTAKERLSEVERAEQPLAGSVLALDVGTVGLPEPRFGV
jgi:sugar lactone lactonase YvrE